LSPRPIRLDEISVETKAADSRRDEVVKSDKRVFKTPQEIIDVWKEDTTKSQRRSDRNTRFSQAHTVEGV